MPYIYSLAGMTYFNDYTIMRPMVMDFTHDMKTRNIKDQYMFGSALLVAPVYKYGARSRDVYFPEGETWYDFYTGETIKAGRTLNVQAPYDIIPLYVRGGSIIPMGGDIQYASQESGEPVTILVYAGKDGNFSIYEDEGTNYNYEKGQYANIPLAYCDKDRTLTIGDRQGTFNGMKTERDFNIVLIDSDNAVNEAWLSKGKAVRYNGKSINIKL